ncbi:hypothetical protein ACFQXA_05590 [Nocardiopsis composta]
MAGVVAGAGARGQVDLGVGLQGPGQGQCEAVQQVGLEVLGDAVGESGAPGVSRARRSAARTRPPSSSRKGSQAAADRP